MKAKTFKDLIVWQKAHFFVLKVYKVTQGFPPEEKFGLTSQFRRAAVSIAANIVEGFPKKGDRDKLRFFNYSQGSIEECRYFILLSYDLKYFDEYSKYDDLLNEVSYLLNSYCRAISKNIK